MKVKAVLVRAALVLSALACMANECGGGVETPRPSKTTRIVCQDASGLTVFNQMVDDAEKRSDGKIVVTIGDQRAPLDSGSLDCRIQR